MSLDTRSPFPHFYCYVLKLHRNARPALGSLSGVLEHVASGDTIAFQSGASLAAELLRHASEVQVRNVAPETNEGD